MGNKTLGDLWKEEGWDGEHGEYKIDITGTFRKESRKFEGGGFGWIIGGRKDQGVGGEAGEETVEDRKIIDQPAVRE